MIKAIIRNNGKILDEQCASSIESLQEFLAPFEKSGVYGKPTYSYQVLLSEGSPAVFEQQELLDGEGQSFDPQQFEEVEVSQEVPAEYDTIIVPAEYEIEYVDISSQLAQEAINQTALDYLASTDWMIIRESEGSTACPQAIKDLRAASRLSIVR